MSLVLLYEDCRKYLLIENGVTATTVRTYKANFREFCRWLESQGLPLDISSVGDYRIFRRFMYYLAERKLHQNTIRQRMISLKTFCKYLLFEGMLQQNPFDRIRVPKKVKGLPKPISDHVRDKFLSLVKCRVASSKNLRDLQAVVMLELGFNCGFRKKAMRLMTWENTDLSAGRCVVIDKGDKEKSHVLMPAAVHWLRQLKLARGVNSGPVLLSPKSGGPISATSLHDEFKRYVVLCGLNPKEINLHRMRHTFGTNALESGYDIREVQELMGHADIGSTLGYVEVSKSRLREKAKKMKIFGRVK